MWNLFLDDERYPHDFSVQALIPQNEHEVWKGWTLIRNVPDCREAIRVYGMPSYMSLDHDLGPGKETGYDFVKWLVDYMLDSDKSPNMVSFKVHSMNPVGKDNMEKLWKNFCDFYEDNC